MIYHLKSHKTVKIRDYNYNVPLCNVRFGYFSNRQFVCEETRLGDMVNCAECIRLYEEQTQALRGQRYTEVAYDEKAT